MNGWPQLFFFSEIFACFYSGEKIQESILMLMQTSNKYLNLLNRKAIQSSI